ncbi:MAG: hypothetical protein JXC32_09650 [Anaerolineae bacterium]|nr:hypothetical protein [Anaerolineae bacterium]
MPYCVRCGVELSANAKRCPLCNTEVILPPDLQASAPPTLPPQQRDIVAGAFDRNLWIQVVSALMAIPALLSVVINAAFGEGLTWSLYVVATLGAAWIWCVSPFLYRRNIVPLWIAIDEVALLGLLYVVDALPPETNWFVPLAVPITLCLAILTLIIVTLARRRVLRELHIVAAALVALSVLCLVVEAAVDRYLTGEIKLQWSLLVVATGAPLAVVAAMLQRRRAIVEGMKFWFRM